MNDQTTDRAARAMLYRKIAAVAGAIETIEKDGTNKDKGYRYATPAGVLAAVKPHLAAQQLAIVPHLVDREIIDTGQASRAGTTYLMTYVKMHYHLIDGESGESMVVPWEAQAGTYGDDKGLAKAQTIALRTFLIQLFQIPAEDPEIDPDARDPRPEHRPAAPPVRQAPAPPTPNGERPLVKRLRELVADCRAASVAVPELPKPKDMTDEALLKAIEELEIDYGLAQRSKALDFDQPPPDRPAAPTQPAKEAPRTGQGQPASVPGVSRRTAFVKPGVVPDEQLPL